MIRLIGNNRKNMNGSRYRHSILPRTETWSFDRRAAAPKILSLIITGSFARWMELISSATCAGPRSHCRFVRDQCIIR